MMKTNKGLIIMLIVLLSIIAILLCGIMVFFISGNSGIFTIRHNEVFYNESFDAAKLTDISIDNDAGDIEIKNSDDGQIKVVANGNNQDNFTVDCSDSTLTIKSKSIPANSDALRRAYCGADIELYVPQNIKSISIVSSFGDIDIKDSLKTNLNLESNCGNIKAENLSGSFNMKCDMGDIKIDAVNISSNSMARTAMGDVEIERTNSVNIAGETSLGECKINNSSSDSPITLTVETNLGDIEIN